MEKKGLKFIENYLLKRKQQTKIGSSWSDVISGVPQRSVTINLYIFWNFQYFLKSFDSVQVKWYLRSSKKNVA